MRRRTLLENLVRYSAITVVVLYSAVQAETKLKVGTTVYPFLEIGVGARAAALGEAYVARATNVTGLFWNPAGIADAQNELSFDYTQWFASLKYNFFGLVANFSQLGTVGLCLTSFYSGPIDVTTVLRPQGTGETYEMMDIALGVAYARSLTDRFNIGGVAKYIHSSLWDMQSSAVAFDIGTMFRSPLMGITIGMSISNFGGAVQYTGPNTLIRHDIDPLNSGNNDKILGHLRTDEWDLPLLFRFGIAREFDLSSLGSFVLSMDALHPNNNAESLNLGLEYAFRQSIFLRIGYKSYGLKDSEEGLTFGGGLDYHGLIIDYSYSDFGLLNYVQRFSCSVKF